MYRLIRFYAVNLTTIQIDSRFLSKEISTTSINVHLNKMNMRIYSVRMMNSVISLLAVPSRLFCFGSLVIDVVCCYLWLFSLYININIGKNSCLMLD